MTNDQKFHALGSLTGGVFSIAVRMRATPGDWYVDHRGVEVKRGGMLESRYGNGETPQAAIQDHWNRLTNLGSNEFIVLNAMDSEKRRHVRWNGYMWENVLIDA